MALEVDVSFRFDSDDRRRCLVEAVLAGDPEDEGRWIEWKSTLDLSTNEHKFKIAKAILALANRIPEQAEQWADGYGYLLVGVEPGQLAGIPRLDVADLEAKVQPYVGTGRRAPRWGAAWVDAEGVSVLVIEVEPPEPGDPLFPLRARSDKAHEGTVFVRRLASSVAASAEEILQLSDRAAGRPRMNLGVELMSPLTWVAIDPQPDEVTRALGVLRRRALSSLREVQRKREFQREARRRKANPLVGGIGFELPESVRAQFAAPAAQILGADPETRSEEEFEAEVEAYVTECETRLTEVLVARWIDEEHGTLSLRLANTTEHHLSAVSIVVSISGPVHVWTDDRATRLSSPPRPYGQPVWAQAASLSRDLAHLGHITAYGIGPQTTDARQLDDGVEVRWSPIDIPPLDSVELDPVPIAVSPVPVDAELTIQWRASSPDTRGVARDTFSVEVASSRLTAEQILALAQAAS